MTVVATTMMAACMADVSPTMLQQGSSPHCPSCVPSLDSSHSLSTTPAMKQQASSRCVPAASALSSGCLYGLAYCVSRRKSTVMSRPTSVRASLLKPSSMSMKSTNEVRMSFLAISTGSHQKYASRYSFHRKRIEVERNEGRWPRMWARHLKRRAA